MTTIEELKLKPIWLNWKCVTKKDGKISKVPYSPKGGESGTDEAHKNTWTTYDFAKSNSSNVGIVFKDGLCGIDIDEGANEEDIKVIIELMSSYTEKSPSGTGYHILFTCDITKLPVNEEYDIDTYSMKTILDDKYYQKNPNNHLECYISGITNRYFTFTGNVVLNLPIADRTDQLIKFINRYMVKTKNIENTSKTSAVTKVLDDNKILNIIRKSNQAEKFSKLYDQGDFNEYNSQSEADIGLCCIFAYYTQDYDQIERLFSQSALFREKWNIRADYRKTTIGKAIELCGNKLTNEFNVQDKTKVKELVTFTARELQLKELPPIIYYVENLLSQGLSIICSAPKIGKSWLALHLCLCITQGLSFLGFKTKRASCLYLALEDSESRLKDRLNKLLKGRNAPINFYYSITSEDINTGLINQLNDFIQKYPDIKVIIIDTLQKVRASVKNNNVYGQDYKELGTIKSFADKNGLCIILIHHVRKGIDNGDVFEKVSGTNAISGAADTTLLLTKKNRSDECTILSVTGRDIEENHYILKFNKETCIWEYISTVDNYKENNEKEAYNENTLVCTIKTLVDENDGSYSGTIKSINNRHKELFDSSYMTNEIKIRKEIDKIKSMLMEYDGIDFIPSINPTPKGGRIHTFKKVFNLVV